MLGAAGGNHDYTKLLAGTGAANHPGDYSKLLAGGGYNPFMQGGYMNPQLAMGQPQIPGLVPTSY